MKKWITAGGTVAILAAGAVLWAVGNDESTNSKDDVSINFDRYEASSEESAVASETDEPEAAETADDPAPAVDETAAASNETPSDESAPTAETDIQVIGVENEDSASASNNAGANGKREPTFQKLNPGIRDQLDRNMEVGNINAAHSMPQNLRQVQVNQFKPKNLPVPDENDQ